MYNLLNKVQVISFSFTLYPAHSRIGREPRVKTLRPLHFTELTSNWFIYFKCYFYMY